MALQEAQVPVEVEPAASQPVKVYDEEMDVLDGDVDPVLTSVKKIVSHERCPDNSSRLWNDNLNIEDKDVAAQEHEETHCTHPETATFRSLIWRKVQVKSRL